ncbi:PASTA domain-containing protein [Nocardia takedensis]|uniref:PASTA domain-containing protein n=1 Tax=Nocardia takedensis TaxID=259390 RepID=UPI0002F25232|nr:PASTA domain-containing protein [Nocardia takedensis]
MRTSAFAIIAVSSLGLLSGCASGSASHPAAASEVSTSKSDNASHVIPDVLGDRPAVARERVEAAGFRVDVIGGTGRGPGGGQCVVGEQIPDGGQQAPADSLVTLRTHEVGPTTLAC